MRTYKGQAFSPTVTPGPKRRKPKPLRRLDRPDRDKLVKPVGRKKPSRVLAPTGRKGRRNPGRATPGRASPPTQPVDPFAAEVQAALDLKYSGEQQALQQELAISGQQHANTDDYYQRYLNDLEKAAQFTTQAYGQGQQGVYAQGTAAAGQDQARMAQNQQQAQQSAALRGTSASVQPEQAGAIGARQAQGGAFGGLLAAHGGAAATLNEGRYAAGAAARVGAHQQEQAREGMAREEARKLVAQRAADEGTVRQELSDAAFKRQLLAKEFGLDVRKQKATEGAARRDDRRESRKVQQARREWRKEFKAGRTDASFEKWKARKAAALADRTEARMLVEANKPPASGGSDSDGPSKLTGPQRRGFQQNYSQAVATLKSAYTYQNGKFTIKHKGKTYTYDLNEMATIIVRDMNVPPEIAKAAVFRAAGRPVPKALARRLRQFELKVPRAKPRPKYEGTPIQRLF